MRSRKGGRRKPLKSERRRSWVAEKLCVLISAEKALDAGVGKGLGFNPVALTATAPQNIGAAHFLRRGPPDGF
jgi:hypothetical protein